MLVVTCWFRVQSGSEEADDRRHGRLVDACRQLATEGWVQHSLRGPGWGAVVIHAPAPGWRWPFVDTTGPRRFSLSWGMPVGTDHATPQSLAEALLEGRDVQSAVVPPFGVVVVDEPGDRAVVQQDWLGMARLFTRATGGVLVLSSRPSLIPVVDEGLAGPDVWGWSGYAASGQFRGSEAPLTGVRLLEPGERLTLTACHALGSPAAVWEPVSDRRSGLDEIAQAGRAQRTAGDLVPVEVAERAAAGMARVAGSLHRLYDGDIQLGLSGGKDSRVIAAALFSGGMTPVLLTNTTTQAEGDTAVDLVELMRSKRGLELQHRLYEAGAPTKVLTQPLLDRAERLRVRYDHQYPSSYLSRPAVAVVRPEMRKPSFTGGGGEILTGYWHVAREQPDRADVVKHLFVKLCAVGDMARLSAQARDAHFARVASIVDHAYQLGLTGEDVADYVYLAERMRRWSSTAYEVGMVTPFLATEVVEAAFALSPKQKAARALHLAMLSALAPEWDDVPFVTSSTGGNPATRVWHGDGLAVLEGLTGRSPGTLAAMLDPHHLSTAVATVKGGRPNGLDAALLAQFVTLAVADDAYGTGPALPSPITTPQPRTAEATGAAPKGPAKAETKPGPPPRLPWLPPTVRVWARHAKNRLRSH
jgi:hypothetical protein